MAQEREGQPVVVVERSGSGLGPFILGLLLGAGVALLLAPRSGAETRRLLRARGRDLWRTVGEKAEGIKEVVEEGLERGKARVEEGIESLRRSLEERRAAAADAVDAGRAAVQSAREELEQRLEEARAARRGGKRGEEEAEDD
jgi:gas vesicle protein